MKLWCFLLIACVIQSLPGSFAKVVPPKQKIAVASVTYTYSGIPRCSGTFVSRDSLLTSATCLFCDQDCDMKVEVLDPYTSRVLHYDIKEILIHEKYELEPSKNDIGLIKIKGKVPTHLVLELKALQPDPTAFATYYYTVKFNDGLVSVQRNKTSLITNAKCSHILHSYIPSDNACLYSTNDFHFQEQNQGSPLVYEYRGKLYLTGIYVPEKQNYAGGSRIAIFEKIGPEINWINKHAKNLPNPPCNSSNTDPKEVPTSKPVPASTIPPLNIPVIPFTVHPPIKYSPSGSVTPKSPSKHAPSLYGSSPHAYSPKAPSQYASSQTYSHKAPAPQSYSHKAPAPQTYSQKAPAPQTYSQKDPPPQTYSQKDPPPQTYSHKASVPQSYSQKAPAPQLYSQKAPAPQTYSQKDPPPQTYSQKDPPPQTYSQKNPPPQTYSQKAPPPQTYSQKAPAKQTSSPKAPAPQIYSTQAPSQYTPHPLGYIPPQSSYISYNPSKHHESEEKRHILAYNPQYYQ